MEKINELQEALNEFEEKFSIDKNILVKYISSAEINDDQSCQMCMMVMSNLCPKELEDDMKKEFKKIIKISLENT